MNEILGALTDFSRICSVLTIIFTFSALVFKPFREKFLGTKEIREGQKCLLRSEMLRIYYKNKDEEKIRQHEFENFIFCYKAYKGLGGNSFIDHIKEEIDSWNVVT